MTPRSEPRTTLIAGASGGIGKALVDHYLQPDLHGKLMTVSREQLSTDHPRHLHLLADLSLPDSVCRLIEFFNTHGIPDQAFQCAGVLHDSSHGPEKSLPQLSADWLHHSLDINVLSHIHLAQAINSVLKRSSDFRWMSLSAMVGSIEDNRSGGWYSYRMTKAALNMFIKTLSIEWRRRYPNAIVASVHPGTTDTPLSEPFQSGLKPEALYSSQVTAERMVRVMSGLTVEDSGGFFHWDGTPLPW